MAQDNTRLGGHPARPQRRGTVLVMVLVITTLAAMLAASVLFRVRAQTAAASVTAQSEQALAVALSGIQAAIAALLESRGDPDIWYDNPAIFQNVLVHDDGNERWYFTLYAHSIDAFGEEEIRYGLIDEAGKLSLLSAREEQLLQLPHMTQALVDALLDYRDADHDPRPQGAEQDYYDSLPVPYVIANGPLATVEELLLVRGFTGEVVYGRDSAFARLYDRAQDDATRRGPGGAGGAQGQAMDGELDRGIAPLLTAFSYGPNVSFENQRRVNLNGNPQRLREVGLSSGLVRFIQQVRADGVTFVHPSQLLGMTHVVQQPQQGLGFAAGQQISAPVDEAQLAILMDQTTAQGGRLEVGKVNVNSAPRQVLTTIPGITPEAADRIIELRGTLDHSTRSNLAWLYTEGVLDVGAFQQSTPLLTGRGFQYRARVIGFSYPGGRYRVLEAVVDVGRGSPRIIYYRDLTRLGLPFEIDPQQRDLW